MDPSLKEQRRTERLPSHGLVMLAVHDGQYKGASLVGMAANISAGGICIVLDGGFFTRGTAVTMEFEDGLRLNGWVTHSTAMEDLSRIGLSFNPIHDEIHFRGRR